MPKVSAFVGRSFHRDDEAIVTIFLKHFEQFRKLGFECEGAEEAESRSVAEKVKAKLADKKVFIGIFTRRFPLAKSATKNLNPNDAAWYSRFLWSKSNLLTASGWTTQESGFAIGKNMQLILLVEEGVIDIGGLHGDHEVITFSRQNPAKCFPALDAQIINLLAEPEKPKAQPDAESIPERPQAVDTQTDPQHGEDKQQGAERNFFLDIHIKLFGDKDYDGAKKILDDWLLTAANDDETVHRRAWFEWMRFKAGYSDGYHELERLKREYPNHRSPATFLARLLKGLGQLSSAAELFEEASRKASNIRRQAELLVEASLCLVADNKYEDANNLLEKSLPDVEGDSAATFELFNGLAQIAKIKKDNDRQVALLEKALSIQPAEHKLRFEIALRYSAMGRHPLALYHYSILAREAPDGSNLNNLGVTYSNLKLPAKAVSHYKSSANREETLAMANLAYKYIQEGFLDEANDIIEKALAFKGFHQNVASARAKIDEIRDEEEKREQDILSSIDDERRFRLAFADAMIIKGEQVPGIKGKWNTPHGVIDMATANGILKGSGTLQQPDFTFGLAESVMGSLQSGPRQITKSIKLEALLQGAAGRGEIKIFTQRGTLLTSHDQEFNIQLIVSSSSQLKVLTTDEKDKISVTNFERLPDG